MKKNLLPCFLFLFLTSLASCSDDDNERFTTPAKQMLPSRMTSTYSSFEDEIRANKKVITYRYNDLCQPTRIEITETSVGYKDTRVTHILNEFSYDQQGQPFTVIRTITKDESAPATAESAFEIEKDRITIRHDDLLLQIDEQGFITNSYKAEANTAIESYSYDRRGNINKIRYSETHYVKFDYHSGYSYFCSVNMPQWFIVKYMCSYRGNAEYRNLRSEERSGEHLLYTYSYEFNDDGYPVTIRLTPADNVADLPSYNVDIEYMEI